jgi:hypothetical protein
MLKLVVHKVQPLYEPGYTIPRVGNLTEKKSSVSNFQFRIGLWIQEVYINDLSNDDITVNVYNTNWQWSILVLTLNGVHPSRWRQHLYAPTLHGVTTQSSYIHSLVNRKTYADGKIVPVFN